MITYTQCGRVEILSPLTEIFFFRESSYLITSLFSNNVAFTKFLSVLKLHIVEITGIHCTPAHFWQKFRESNSFTKEITT